MTKDQETKLAELTRNVGKSFEALIDYVHSEKLGEDESGDIIEPILDGMSDAIAEKIDKLFQ